MELRNQFLLAMPSLGDPNFQRTLTLICEHSPQGAMGLVVNRPLTISLGEILQHLDIAPPTGDAMHQPVYFGGPVESERGFVVHTPVGQWEGTLKVSDRLGITTSRDILEAIACGEGPDRMLITLGYSGWAAGQLEHELTQNAWLTTTADQDILFDLPAEERLATAAARLGIDLDLLSSEAGHA